ncbi:MAG: TIGR01212 family radical SAM protein [Clostridia bacterium]|nr:TIGR01212 family radical SAM protein [Clostridia bacterium]
MDGFTCPNRDGKLGLGGCIYCSERGSGELINSLGSITEQVKHYFTTYKAQRANKFIVYFQNFTNTYDTIERLKEKYDAALVDDRIVGLEIGTRPDCINEEIAKLLKSYTDKYYVCVELGLQTSSNEIGKIINRGYTSEQFTKAVEILNKYDIDVVAHIMVGLPNETKEDIKNTVNFINKHKLQGIKIHSTYVVENTVLANMYKKGKYTALELDDYIETLIDIITHLKPELVIYRISGDAPKDILVAPYWNKHKMWILHGFEKRFRARDLWQGKFYNS